MTFGNANAIFHDVQTLIQNITLRRGWEKCIFDQNIIVSASLVPRN